MSQVVRLENVSKSYGSTIALDRVSLEIPSGCVFALLGENGAGKSTTIKTMMGLVAPDSGKVEVLGSRRFPLAPQQRARIGYIPEFPVLYDWMTVDEIGWFTAGFYPPGFLANFAAQIQQFEIDSRQKIQNLSKGGRAKVALALALSPTPELLVLDEPTSGLDTLVRRQFLESMVDVAATGRTVLLSSHQIGEVERVAEHVAILHRGKLMVCDTLEKLKASHQRWQITFTSHDHALPDFPGTVIQETGLGSRRRQWLVRDPQPDSIALIRDFVGVVDFQAQTPSLEDLFVAYIQRPEPSDDSQPVEPVGRVAL